MINFIFSSAGRRLCPCFASLNEILGNTKFHADVNAYDICFISLMLQLVSISLNATSIFLITCLLSKIF